jgi:hypothetical protein
MSTVESICADLGIKIIPCNEALGPMLTKAAKPCAEFSSSTVKATASSCCVPSRNRQATIAR